MKKSFQPADDIEKYFLLKLFAHKMMFEVMQKGELIVRVISLSPEVRILTHNENDIHFVVKPPFEKFQRFPFTDFMGSAYAHV